MKTIHFFLACFFCNILIAQTYNSTVGGVISDNNIEKCFPLPISGVGTISATFGLARVCINITHKFDGDLEIRLKAPDGTTVPLAIRNGGNGDNYTNTCFTGVSPNPISTGTAPYTGTFLPQGFLGSVNNNQNADGIWNLCIKDVSRPDSGMLIGWSITFSNNPAPQPPPPPLNDDPCTAFSLPVSNNCTYSTYSNYAATNSIGIPAPGCANYVGGDVWFKVDVPTSGIIQIDTKEGTVLDGGMAVYSGTTCDDLTLIKCDDNNSANGFMPQITISGLPRTTVWVRVWERYNDNNGTFGICVTTPPPQPSCAGNPIAGNRCNQAPPVCNNEGFCGNTSASYTVDTWPELSAAFNCGTIQNNSFVKFTAAASDVSFYVWVLNSTKNSGIQMMIYSGGCLSGPVTRHACYQRIPPSNGVPSLVSANGLTPGNEYFIMVDGFNADVCDYVIAPNTGTSVLNVAPTSAASPEICRGKSVQLTASGGNNSYIWSPAAGLNKTAGSTVIASPDTTTTYTITSNAPTGCTGTSTKTITVTVYPSPTLGLDKNVSVCAGASFDLTSVFPVTGLITVWSLNGVSVSRPDSVTVGGIYKLIALNSSKCSDTAQVVLTIISRLQLGSDKTVIICPGVSTDLTTLFNTTGLSVSWTKNGSAVPNPTSVNIPGAYQLVVTDGVSCPDTAIVNLSIASSIPGPPFKVAICPKQIPYLWKGKGYSTSGIYYDTLSSVSGCDSVITLQLTVNANSSSTTIVNVCPSQIPYLWNGSTYSATGSYNKTILNAAGCDSVMTLQLFVKSATSSTNNVSICPNQTPYVWNGNPYSTTGVYSFKTINSQGCDSTVTLVLTLNPTPSAVFAASNSPVCSGTSIDLTATSVAGGSYTWTGPANFKSNEQNPTILDITSGQGGFYSVTVSINGCPSTATTTRVDILQAPVIKLGFDKQAYEGDTVVLDPQITGNPIKFLWTPSDYFITTDSIRNPSILAVTTMQYSLVVTGSNSCISKPDYITIKVLTRIKPYNIPNSFSPNADGINDKWVIKDIAAFPKVSVQVFTRNGYPVFSSEGVYKSWDGTAGNKLLPAGIYYYVIKVKPDSKPITGWVSIFK